MVSTWGEPDFSNTDPMQGPAQMTAVADFAMARGIRHFATQADLLAVVASAPADAYAVVLTIPGGLFRFDGVGGVKLVTTPKFVNAAARSAGITTPVDGMIAQLETEQFARRYVASSAKWVATGAAAFRIIPTNAGGTGTSFTIDTATGDLNFVGATALNVDGLFVSDFDTYLVIVDIYTMGSGGGGFTLRKNGVPNTGATSYATKRLWAVDGGGLFSDIAVSNTFAPIPSAGVEHTVTLRVKNPMVAALPTKLAFETDSWASGTTGGTKAWGPGRHNVADAFDGVGWTFGAAATGRIQAWGLV